MWQKIVASSMKERKNLAGRGRCCQADEGAAAAVEDAADFRRCDHAANNFNLMQFSL
jgi:hypothetical protein